MGIGIQQFSFNRTYLIKFPLYSAISKIPVLLSALILVSFFVAEMPLLRCFLQAEVAFPPKAEMSLLTTDILFLTKYSKPSYYQY